MKRDRIIYGVLLLAAWISMTACSNSVFDGIASYRVDVQKEEKADKFFSSYRFVPLETSDECLLSEIKSMKVTTNEIAILSNNVVFLFDHKGKFVNKVDHYGRGNNEYLDVADFIVNDTCVFILSRLGKKIFVYGKDGKYNSSVRLNDGYQHFAFLDNRYMVLSSENSNDQGMNYVFFDHHNNEYAGGLDKFEGNEGVFFGGYTPFCGRDSSGLFITKPYDNIVYHLSKDKFQSHYQYEFNTQDQLSDNSSGKSLWDLSRSMSNKNAVSSFEAYFEMKTNKYLIYSLFDASSGGRGTNLSRIDAKGDITTMRFNRATNKKYPYCPKPICVYEGSLVGYYTPFTLFFIEKENKLSKFKKMGIKESDNPVIFFHKIK